MKGLRAGLRRFWIAVGFLTILPTPRLGPLEPGEFRRASAYYPLVGYLMGAVLYAAFILTGNLPPSLRAGLVLALWLALSGMLHFDGLLDAADAVFSARSASERRAVLADVHLGSFAFAVGFIFLLLKWQALVLLPTPLPLLAVLPLARFAVFLPMRIFPVIGRGLAREINGGPVWPALLAVLPVVLIWPLMTFGVLAWTLLISSFASRRLGGGLNGDIYGAIIETAELVGLLLVVLT